MQPPWCYQGVYYRDTINPEDMPPQGEDSEDSLPRDKGDPSRPGNALAPRVTPLALSPSMEVAG